MKKPTSLGQRLARVGRLLAIRMAAGWGDSRFFVGWLLVTWAVIRWSVRGWSASIGAYLLLSYLLDAVATYYELRARRIQDESR